MHETYRIRYSFIKLLENSYFVIAAIVFIAARFMLVANFVVMVFLIVTMAFFFLMVNMLFTIFMNMHDGFRCLFFPRGDALN